MYKCVVNGSQHTQACKACMHTVAHMFHIIDAYTSMKEMVKEFLEFNICLVGLVVHFNVDHLYIFMPVHVCLCVCIHHVVASDP